MSSPSANALASTAPIAPRRIAARGGRRAAFTLLEILLSLAIIGLFAAILIGGSSRLMSDQPMSVDETFWVAVREARKTALKNEREVRLSFESDRENQPAFVLNDAGTVQKFPIHPSMREDLSVEFFTTQKGGPTILVAGVLLESRPAKYVAFYPDGTCMAFRAQVARLGGAHTLSIDPWTCAPVLTPADPFARR